MLSSPSLNGAQVRRLFLAIVATAILPDVLRADPAVDALRDQIYRHAVRSENEAALPLARELVVATEKAFGDDHLETAASLDVLAASLQKTGQIAEAEKISRRSLEILERRLGLLDPEVACSLMQLGMFLEQQQQFAEATECYRRALSALDETLGANHPDVALPLANLHRIHISMGLKAESKAYHERELNIHSLAEQAEPLVVPIRSSEHQARRPFSPRAGDRLWNSHNVAGAGYFTGQDFDAALFHFTRATRLRSDLGETHNNLGSVLSTLGRTDDAVVEFTEAVRLQPDAPSMRVNLANALMVEGLLAEAAKEYRTLVEASPKNATLQHNLGVILFKMGRKEEAIEQFLTALKIDPTLEDARAALEESRRQDAEKAVADEDQ